MPQATTMQSLVLLSALYRSRENFTLSHQTITHRIRFANQKCNFLHQVYQRNCREKFAERFASSRKINDENKIEENKILTREMENGV